MFGASSATLYIVIDSAVLSCLVRFDWPQANEPFDQETLDYISKLDIEADLNMLRSTLGIREECLGLARITGHILKRFLILFRSHIYCLAACLVAVALLLDSL